MGYRNQTRRKGGGLFPLLVAVMMVILVVIVGIAIYKNLSEDGKNPGSSSNSESGTEAGKNSEAESETQEPEITEDVETFVILGVDSREGLFEKGSRSDSIMLVNVNHDKGEVKVISIFRDCMTYQPGYGYKELTYANYYEGSAYAVSVINQNFDLDLENYVTVNFGTLIKLVDEVGGVEIQLRQGEIDIINASCKSDIKGEGVHLLNGEQALVFSRIRAIDTDYHRAERQREVLFEIFKKSKSMGTMERLELADDMMDEMVTNYSSNQITSLLYYLSKYKIVSMTAYPQVFYGGIVEGIWVEVPTSLIDMNTALHKELYGTENYTPSAEVQLINDTLLGKVEGPNTDLREQEE